MTKRTAKQTESFTEVLSKLQICLRAYELYEQRGREDGHDVEDWLRAEEEVKQMQRRSVAA